MNTAPSPPRRLRAVLFALHDETVAHAFARIVESRAHASRVVLSIEEAILGGPADVVVAEFRALVSSTASRSSTLSEIWRATLSSSCRQRRLHG